MKRLTYFIFGALIVLAPLSASAIEAMNADSMKAATGQAGVSIAIDDVILYQNTGDITYVDNDGTDGNAAGIKITGGETLLYIDALIIGDGTEGASGIDYTSANYLDGALDPSALTIDVGRCDVLTAIGLANGDLVAGEYTGGVVIGLPTIEIYDALGSNDQVISLVQSTAANNGEEFIEIQTSGSMMALLGGDAVVEIAPH